MKNKFSFFLTLIFAIIVNSCTKKATTKGKVVDISYSKIIGYDWSAKAWYEYEVNDKLYTDSIYFSEYEVLGVGDDLLIEYSIENPHENKIKN